MKVITAYPKNNPPDALIEQLCSRLTRAVNALFYVDLRNREGGSGFYAESRDRKGAYAEARAHLRKYPTWETATVSESLDGIEGRRLRTFKN